MLNQNCITMKCLVYTFFYIISLINVIKGGLELVPFEEWLETISDIDFKPRNLENIIDKSTACTESKNLKHRLALVLTKNCNNPVATGNYSLQVHHTYLLSCQNTQKLTSSMNYEHIVQIKRLQYKKSCRINPRLP